MLEGIVISAQGGSYAVQAEQGDFQCALRHHVVEAEERRRSETNDMPYVDLVAAGDRVQMEPSDSDQGRGYIEEILERKTRFGRTRMDGWRQVIVGNLDLLLIVFAARQPQLKLRMIDRFLVTAEASGLIPVIIINKMDLVAFDDLKSQMALYEDLGYKVIYTSTLADTGIDDVRQIMGDQISAFVGSSGVGKSSLLNAIQPGLSLRVGEVDERRHKGQHTTTTVTLLPLAFGGYVADTPGVRTLGLLDIDEEQAIDVFFPDLRPYLPSCQYRSCRHSQEPGCAVQAAVKSGQIDSGRYDSYLRLSGLKEGRFERNIDKKSSKTKNRERRRGYAR
ncbi:MAG: ribosome small subunit-dependent GTPase A [Candidatus Latescibacteria bacterium]|nr:ribosome small subunit-dependent GTPase A [Candidatus Latescibacterota bacterium]